MITTIAGGVGAARMMRGIVAYGADRQCVAVVNVGDDDQLHGLHISPDIDTVLYTLAEQIDPERGWGLVGETWEAMNSLRRYAASVGRADIGWFNLGDSDLGTHLFRTTRLNEGAPLHEVTAELGAAWNLGATLIPATNHQVRTRLTTANGELSFQEYFVRDQHDVKVSHVHFAGADVARPAPGVLDAIAQAEAVVIAPSNPLISIGPILAIPGIHEAIAARRSHTVAVSPIIAGRALKGPADRLLSELGYESSALGVARLYQEFAGTMVIDDQDADIAAGIEALGMRCVVTDTIMSDPAASARLAAVVVNAVR